MDTVGRAAKADSFATMANSIEVILNAGSGSHEAKESRGILEKVFRKSGRSFAISVAKGDEIGRLAQEKAKGDCEVLVAGGGDGGSPSC